MTSGHAGSKSPPLEAMTSGYRRADGRADRWADLRADGRRVGRAGGQTGGQVDGRADGRMGAQTARRAGGQANTASRPGWEYNGGGGAPEGIPSRGATGTIYSPPFRVGLLEFV